MKCKMDQDRIPSWRQSTDAQWAAIHARSLTLAPVATPGGGWALLWQTDTDRGRSFTECFDSLLKDVAKKHRNTLESQREHKVLPFWPLPFWPEMIVSCLNESAFNVYTVC